MRFLQGNNLPGVKASNQSAILRMIYYYGAVQRMEIAERLGLTLPTITTNINKMLADGLVKEKGVRRTASGSSGRRAKCLEINAEACYFAGVELRGEQWNICITDFCGRMLASCSGVQRNTDYGGVMEQLGKDFAGCLLESGRALEDLSGIGFCLPGLVDRENGLLKVNARYQWFNKDVRKDFARITGYGGRITVENSATARGVSMQLFHWEEVENTQSFAYMVVASGIACPLFLNKSGFQGAVLGAGEAGHMVIEPRGRMCSCGNRGCLEAYASEQAIIDDCKKELRKGRAKLLAKLCAPAGELTLSAILRAQEAGDPDVCRIIEEAVYRLATSVTNIINFTRPDIMLIDCQLFGNEHNREFLLERAESSLYSPTYPGTVIEFVRADKFNGALGAVAVAIDENLEISV